MGERLTTLGRHGHLPTYCSLSSFSSSSSNTSNTSSFSSLSSSLQTCSNSKKSLTSLTNSNSQNARFLPSLACFGSTHDALLRRTTAFGRSKNALEWPTKIWEPCIEVTLLLIGFRGCQYPAETSLINQGASEWPLASLPNCLSCRVS